MPTRTASGLIQKEDCWHVQKLNSNSKTSLLPSTDPLPLIVLHHSVLDIV